MIDTKGVTNETQTVHDDISCGNIGVARADRLAEPAMQRACALWVEVQAREVVPDAVRLFAEFRYAAVSWHRPLRVVQKAEVMRLGENPRFVVTSLEAPTLFASLKNCIVRGGKRKTGSST